MNTKRGWIFESELSKGGWGRMTKGSGNTPWDKEDLRGRKTLIQAKSTGKESFSVKKKDFLELLRNASQAGCLGLYVVDLNGLELAVLRLSDLQHLLEENNLL